MITHHGMTFVDASHLRAFKRDGEAGWLRRRGFDGLWWNGPDACGCWNDDLYPCGHRGDCRPGVERDGGLYPVAPPLADPPPASKG